MPESNNHWPIVFHRSIFISEMCFLYKIHRFQLLLDVCESVLSTLELQWPQSQIFTAHYQKMFAHRERQAIAIIFLFFVLLLLCILCEKSAACVCECVCSSCHRHIRRKMNAFIPIALIAICHIHDYYNYNWLVCHVMDFHLVWPTFIRLLYSMTRA